MPARRSCSSAGTEWATRPETLPSMKLNHWHDVRGLVPRASWDAGLRVEVVPPAYDWTGYKTIVLLHRAQPVR